MRNHVSCQHKELGKIISYHTSPSYNEIYFGEIEWTMGKRKYSNATVAHSYITCRTHHLYLKHNSVPLMLGEWLTLWHSV